MTTINKSYVICGFARTGSQYLCHALSQISVLGKPQNYFSKDMYIPWCQKYKITETEFSKHFERYLYFVMQTAGSAQGLLGFKASNYVFFQELWPIISDARRCQKHELLDGFVKNLQFIYLTRKDTLRQAISITRAQQTNVWFVSRAQELSSPVEPVFEYEKIRENLAEISQRDKEWEDFFSSNKITPLRITYEDIYPDPQPGISRILSFLGIKQEFLVALEKIPIKKQQDALTEQWVQLYRQQTALF